MKTYLRKNNSKKLVVFFLGWAMDETPFEVLESSEYDVLFVYDYTNLDLELDFEIYSEKILIAFSYGVFMASVVQEKLPDFQYKIAINGTLKPIDREEGISEKIFNLTLNSVSEASMDKFYSKMFDNNLDYEYFLEYLPKRSADEYKIELGKIKEYFLEKKYPLISFDKSLVSQSDKIFPTKSQMNFWKNINTKKVEAGHFLFYKFKSICEIINL